MKSVHGVGLPSVPDAQRACYIALRRKGWIVEKGRIAGWNATKPERQESVWGANFQQLLNKAAELDAAWQRKGGK